MDASSEKPGVRGSGQFTSASSATAISGRTSRKLCASCSSGVMRLRVCVYDTSAKASAECASAAAARAIQTASVISNSVASATITAMEVSCATCSHDSVTPEVCAMSVLR